MSTEQIKTTDANKALVHRLINEWWGTNTPDPSVADELIGPDFIDHGMPGQVPVPKVSSKGLLKTPLSMQLPGATSGTPWMS